MGPEYQDPTAPTCPPFDLAAEQALLGAMVANPCAIAAARGGVISEDFYRPQHGKVFGVIDAMDERDESVDIVTLAAELRRQGLLDEVGGQDFIFALPDLCPVAANVAEYAAIVNEMARRRDGIALSRRLEQAFADGSTLELEAASRELLELVGGSAGNQEPLGRATAQLSCSRSGTQTGSAGSLP